MTKAIIRSIVAAITVITPAVTIIKITGDNTRHHDIVAYAPIAASLRQTAADVISNTLMIAARITSDIVRLRCCWTFSSSQRSLSYLSQNCGVSPNTHDSLSASSRVIGNSPTTSFIMSVYVSPSNLAAWSWLICFSSRIFAITLRCVICVIRDHISVLSTSTNGLQTQPRQTRMCIDGEDWTPTWRHRWRCHRQTMNPMASRNERTVSHHVVFRWSEDCICGNVTFMRSTQKKTWNHATCSRSTSTGTYRNDGDNLQRQV